MNAKLCKRLRRAAERDTTGMSAATTRTHYRNIKAIAASLKKEGGRSVSSGFKHAGIPVSDNEREV